MKVDDISTTMPPKSEPSNKDPERFNTAEEFAKPAVKPTNKVKVRNRNNVQGTNKHGKRERIIGPCEKVTLPCEDGQRYIDPSDCRSYYVCASRHRLVRLTCPLGTAWHHKARVCVDDRNVYNTGLCDQTYPSHRCPRDGKPAGIRPQRPVQPRETTVTGTLGLSKALQNTTSNSPTVAMPRHRNEMMYSNSKMTTLKPLDKEVPPGGQLERSEGEMIVIAVVGGLIFAALIAIILVLIWRKRRDEKSSSSERSSATRQSDQKPPKRCIHNPEYSRRNSVIYAEIDDVLRGPLMTSTVSRDRGKTMCARLEHHLPPLCVLPEPLTPQISGISSLSSRSIPPDVIYNSANPESDRDDDATFYEKLSSNNSESNTQATSLEGYDYIENGTGHLYSTLTAQVKETRYELLNEMSSASVNPSDSPASSGTSSPDVTPRRPDPSVPSDYFTLDIENKSVTQ